MEAVEKLKQKINNMTINYENSLDFMMSEADEYTLLIKRYICSQLEVKFHFYGLTESLDYHGKCEEPLLQIIRGEDPILIKKAIEYEKKFSYENMSKNDIFTQATGSVFVGNERMSKSKSIYLSEVVIPNKIKEKQLEFDNLHKLNFTKKKRILKEIDELLNEMDKHKKISRTYVSKYSVQESQDEIKLKQRDWEMFYEEIINCIKKNPAIFSQQSIRELMLDKAFIPSRMHNLRNDIVLNFNLLKASLNIKTKNNDLYNILFSIRTQFKENISPDGAYSFDYISFRDENLLTQNSDFFKSVSKGKDVKSNMENLKEEYNKLQNINDYEEYIKKSIHIFQKLLLIHPYYDGNGRTSRYLFYCLLANKGIIPPVLYDTYMQRPILDALTNKYRNGDFESLNNYVVEKIEESEQLIENNRCAKRK